MQAAESTNSFNFSKISPSVINFLTNPVSALFYTTIKDRLYCDSAHSVRRQSAQFVLYNILNSTLKTIAPIVPHLAEELYSHFPWKKSSSYFTGVSYTPDPQWRNMSIIELMDIVLNIKRDINKEHGADTLGISVDISCSKDFTNLLMVTILDLDQFVVTINIFLI